MLKSHNDASTPSGHARPGAANQTGLTPAELRVRNRVICGASNAAIAARYVITEKTVQKHLANVYAKLGLGEGQGAEVQDQANKRVLLTQLAMRMARVWAGEAVRPHQLAFLQALATGWHQDAGTLAPRSSTAPISRELGALCAALTPLALREGALPLANEPGRLSSHDAVIFHLLADGLTLGAIARRLRGDAIAELTSDDKVVIELTLWRIGAALMPLIGQG